jgi:hypothetical protein
LITNAAALARRRDRGILKAMEYTRRIVPAIVTPGDRGDCHRRRVPRLLYGRQAVSTST